MAGGGTKKGNDKGRRNEVDRKDKDEPGQRASGPMKIPTAPAGTLPRRDVQSTPCGRAQRARLSPSPLHPPKRLFLLLLPPFLNLLHPWPDLPRVL
eukprot:9014178-Pyramimonas_sp.AAC.1